LLHHFLINFYNNTTNQPHELELQKVGAQLQWEDDAGALNDNQRREKIRD
jgi:hypothetical protein